jgi:GntR family transcriptional regulator
LIERIRQLILTGVFEADSQLPSVRSLSCQLSVNPNTIQKAYTYLCNAGLTYSVAGKGCFVSRDAKTILGQDARSQLPQFGQQVKTFLDSGIDPQELKDYIDKIATERSQSL